MGCPAQVPQEDPFRQAAGHQPTCSQAPYLPRQFPLSPLPSLDPPPGLGLPLGANTMHFEGSDGGPSHAPQPRAVPELAGLDSLASSLQGLDLGLDIGTALQSGPPPGQVSASCLCICSCMPACAPKHLTLIVPYLCNPRRQQVHIPRPTLHDVTCTMLDLLSAALLGGASQHAPEHASFTRAASSRCPCWVPARSAMDAGAGPDWRLQTAVRHAKAFKAAGAPGYCSEAGAGWLAAAAPHVSPAASVCVVGGRGMCVSPTVTVAACPVCYTCMKQLIEAQPLHCDGCSSLPQTAPRSCALAMP